MVNNTNFTVPNKEYIPVPITVSLINIQKKVY